MAQLIAERLQRRISPLVGHVTCRLSCCNYISSKARKGQYSQVQFRPVLQNLLFRQTRPRRNSFLKIRSG